MTSPPRSSTQLTSDACIAWLTRTWFRDFDWRSSTFFRRPSSAWPFEGSRPRLETDWLLDATDEVPYTDAMSRKRFDHMNCGVGRALEVFGDWWTLLIIRDAFLGLTRFGQFERSLGIAKN